MKAVNVAIGGILSWYGIEKILIDNHDLNAWILLAMGIVFVFSAFSSKKSELSGSSSGWGDSGGDGGGGGD